MQLGARIFVDGNNVMGSRPDRWWLDRRGAARRLLEQVAELARADSAKWTVVFDDRPPKHSAASPPVEGVTVEYPERRGRNGADNHIVRLLALLPQGSDVLLYTSDRNLRERAAATGARVEGARALLSRLEDLQQPRDSAIGEATLTTRPELTVRPATPDDVPQLMAFIRGIAEFEHLTHQLEATEEGLRSTLFGDSPAVPRRCWASSTMRPRATPSTSTLFSTFLGRRGLYLEDIYVSPEHRRQGLGAMLMRRVAAIAVERGCGRFEWAALDWNTDAHRFYEGLGAEMLSQWRLFRMTGEPLRRLAEGRGRARLAMARSSWYRDHPRHCTCYWCNEGRQRGRRVGGWHNPFRRRRREPPTTPLPDWMLEGLESPTAEESDGVVNETPRRLAQPRSEPRQRRHREAPRVGTRHRAGGRRRMAGGSAIWRGVRGSGTPNDGAQGVQP